jgi:hypothetical protein
MKNFFFSVGNPKKILYYFNTATHGDDFIIGAQKKSFFKNDIRLLPTAVKMMFGITWHWISQLIELNLDQN